VRHFGEHLKASGASAEALLELVDPAWQTAWEVAVDDFNGFVRDVTRAQRARREAAAQVVADDSTPAAAAAVRCAIVEARLADVVGMLSGELALQLVRHGVRSERRAVEAVLALERDGSVVIGLGALAPVLGESSLAIALESVAAADPVGWFATHGGAMAALPARRAQLDGTRVGLAVIADTPPGTGRAVAVLVLLGMRPDAAGAAPRRC
jgi:hypothetical protein